MTFRSRTRGALGLAAALGAAVVGAQEISIPAGDYGRLLAPLMTEAELSGWESLTGAASRTAFIDRFWALRDPTPGTSTNETRAIFEARARRAGERFEEAGTPGYATDRGRVLVVFGLPDEQELRAVPAGSNATLTWRYSRGELDTTVSFTADGDVFRLADRPELSNAMFLASLSDDLRLRLGATVGGAQGALRLPETTASRVGAGVDSTGDDTSSGRRSPTPPEVAPEVKIWMEMVFSGVVRDEIVMRARTHYFPALEGTYSVLAFELDKAQLDFALPTAVEIEATLPPGEVEGAASATPPVVGAEQQPRPADEVQDGNVVSPATKPAADATRADLRVFGAFLQGEPGSENTIHRFIVPYSLAGDAGDDESSPTLSIAVTLTPGEYRLAWGVLDAASGRAVTRDETVIVPDFAETEFQLTEPLLTTSEIRDDITPMSVDAVYEGVRLGNVLVRSDVDDVVERDDTVEVVVVATGWSSDPAAPGKPRLEVEYRILEGLEGDESLARLATQLLDFNVLGQQIPLGQIERLRRGRAYRIEVRATDLVSGKVALQRLPIYVRAAEVPEQN